MDQQLLWKGANHEPGTYGTTDAVKLKRLPFTNGIPKVPRFITTRVDEAAHAASMGIPITKPNPTDKSTATSSICDSDDCLNDSSNEESRSETNVTVSKSSSNLSTAMHGFNVE
ncbi:unnamed protein product [Callosobruchus maculatus]|uniref:Uncharacterized protein n=1 Tax=Callosobruchus maculatus TaxID=64391 RepID=A0A653D7V2_CALMS|nr:unnamed protein product [Callosobruchus maculatus]